MGTSVDGKDYIAAATNGKNEFTVTQGSAIAGKIKVTINKKEIVVAVAANESASTIAKNIANVISNDGDIGGEKDNATGLVNGNKVAKVKARAVGSTVKITTVEAGASDTAGADNKVEISVNPGFEVVNS